MYEQDFLAFMSVCAMNLFRSDLYGGIFCRSQLANSAVLKSLFMCVFSYTCTSCSAAWRTSTRMGSAIETSSRRTSCSTQRQLYSNSVTLEGETGKLGAVMHITSAGKLTALVHFKSLSKTMLKCCLRFCIDAHNL